MRLLGKEKQNVSSEDTEYLAQDSPALSHGGVTQAHFRTILHKWGWNTIAYTKLKSGPARGSQSQRVMNPWAVAHMRGLRVIQGNSNFSLKVDRCKESTESDTFSWPVYNGRAEFYLGAFATHCRTDSDEQWCAYPMSPDECRCRVAVYDRHLWCVITMIRGSSSESEGSLTHSSPSWT